MRDVLKVCKPFQLLFIVFTQILSVYFLGFGNSLDSIYDTIHLAIYISTFFLALYSCVLDKVRTLTFTDEKTIEGHTIPLINWSFFAFVSAILALATGFIINTSLGIYVSGGLALITLNVLVFSRLPFLGNIFTALIGSLFLLVLIPFDSNIKIKLLLIFSIYVFGIQLLKEGVRDLIGIEFDRKSGGKSIPILFGIQTNRWSLLFLLFIFILIITTGVRLIMLQYFTPPLSYVYLTFNLLCIGLPLFLMMSKLQLANTIKDLMEVRYILIYAQINICLSMMFF